MGYTMNIWVTRQLNVEGAKTPVRGSIEKVGGAACAPPPLDWSNRGMLIMLGNACMLGCPGSETAGMRAYIGCNYVCVPG